MSPNIKKRIFKSKLLLKLVSMINFYRIHSYIPHANPQTFNDVIFKLKLEIDKDFLRCFVSDKEYVKDFIENTVGQQHIVPTIAVLRNEQEVKNFFSQPISSDIVVKPTHMSGECLFFKKNTVISEQQLAYIIKWLGINYFYITGEANYKDLLPKIIVEDSLCDENGHVPTDYKIYCTKGKAVMIQVDRNRFSNRIQEFYTPEWKKLPIALGKLPTGISSAPANLQQIIQIAEQIATYFSHIRIDCYSVNGRIYIGEITNVYGNAGMKFQNRHHDYIIGNLILTGNNEQLLQMLVTANIDTDNVTSYGNEISATVTSQYQS